MFNKKVVAALAASGMAFTGLAIGIAPAQAFDPVSNSYAIVGSDTLEDVVGALVNGTKITGSLVRVKTSSSSTMGSFDATGSGTIITKPGTNRFQRPNGSGDGRTAIEKQIAGSLYTSSYASRDTNWDAQPLNGGTGNIDIVRGSSGGTTSGDGTDVLARYTFGRDAIAYAYSAGLTPAQGYDPAAIPATDMASLYHCDSTTLAHYGLTTVTIPQAGSGTRNDFISKLATAANDSSLTDAAIVANYQTTTNNVTTGCVLVGQEHDASNLPAQSLTPMSASRWIAMKNGASYDKSGTAILGSLVSINGTAVPSVNVSSGVYSPNVDYYKDSIWGRDTYLFVDRRRVDSSSVTPTATAASGDTSAILSSTASLYAGQAVSGTGIAGATTAKSIWSSQDAKLTGASGDTTVGTTALPNGTFPADAGKVGVVGTSVPDSTTVSATFAGGSLATTAAAASGDTTVTLSVGDAAKVAKNSAVSGTGVASGVVVSSVSGTTVTLSSALTAAVTSGTKLTFGAAITLSNGLTAALSGGTVQYRNNVKATAASGATFVQVDSAVGGSGQIVSATGITAGTTIKNAYAGGTLGVAANTASGATELDFSSVTSIGVGAKVTEAAVSGSQAVIDHIGSGVTVTAVKNGVAAVVAETTGSSTVTLSATDVAKVAVNSPVSGVGIASGTTVSSISGTTVTLSSALTATGSNTVTFGGVVTLSSATTGALSKSKITAADSANKRYVGDLVDPIKFGAVIELSAPTTAALDGSLNLTLERTVVLSNATTAALSATTLTFTSTFYDAVLAALFNYDNETSLTYQGGSAFSYANMTAQNYPSFLAYTAAAVKLKYGFLPSSVQTVAYAH